MAPLCYPHPNEWHSSGRVSAEDFCLQLMQGSMGWASVWGLAQHYFNSRSAGNVSKEPMGSFLQLLPCSLGGQEGGKG